MTEDDFKKLGPLDLFFLEGLTGHALQIAQLLGMGEISKPKGPEYLMEQLLYRPGSSTKPEPLHMDHSLGIRRRVWPSTLKSLVLVP